MTLISNYKFKRNSQSIDLVHETSNDIRINIRGISNAVFLVFCSSFVVAILYINTSNEIIINMRGKSNAVFPVFYSSFVLLLYFTDRHGRTHARTHTHTHTHTEERVARHTSGQKPRQTYRRRGVETDRYRHTSREREIERQTDRDKKGMRLKQLKRQTEINSFASSFLFSLLLCCIIMFILLYLSQSYLPVSL